MRVSSSFKCWFWSFILLFILLFSISLPIDYNSFKINKYFVLLFEKIIDFIFTSFNFKTHGITISFASDSTGLYLNILLISFLSCILSFLVIKFFTRKKTKQLVYTYSSYFLAFQMLIYGFNKIFKWQFYDAHPNTLFTPLGYLTKDFLYWTSMGSSYLYSLATGCIEVLIGVLLLFKSTRIFAACFGFLVILHIVLINFAFDINVKIHSIFLLLLCTILLYPNIKILVSFFFLNKQKSLISISNPIFKIKKQTYIFIKTIVIMLLFSEALYPYFKANNFNGDLKEKSLFYGAYTIKNHNIYKRFFFHSDPYFIIQDKTDKLYSFPVLIIGNKLKIKHNNDSSLLDISTDTINPNIIQLQGDFFGNHLNIEGRKIDLTQMPLYEDDFHWTIDSYN